MLAIRHAPAPFPLGSAAAGSVYSTRTTLSPSKVSEVTDAKPHCRRRGSWNSRSPSTERRAHTIGNWWLTQTASPPAASAASRAARDAAAAAGGEAVCVSHQLPIVCARRSVEGLRLYHDPRKRQCGLASVTSLTFDGEAVVEVEYAEPAAALPSGKGAGA